MWLMLTNTVKNKFKRICEEKGIIIVEAEMGYRKIIYRPKSNIAYINPNITEDELNIFINTL